MTSEVVPELLAEASSAVKRQKQAKGSVGRIADGKKKKKIHLPGF